MPSNRIGVAILGVAIALGVGVKLTWHLWNSTPAEAAAESEPLPAPPVEVIIPTTLPVILSPQLAIKNPFGEASDGGGFAPLKRARATPQQLERARVWLAKAHAEILTLKKYQAPPYAYLIEGYARCDDREALKDILPAAQRVFRDDKRGWSEEARAAGHRVHIGEAEIASRALNASDEQKLRIYGHIFIANALREHGDMAGFTSEMNRAIRSAANSGQANHAEPAVQIAKSLAEEGNLPLALRAADLIKGGGRFYYAGSELPLEPFHTRALTQIAEVRAKRNDFAGARAALDKTATPAARDSVLAAIAEAQAAAKDTDAAIATAKSIKTPTHQHRASVALGVAFMRSGELAKAREAFSDARRIAREIPRDYQGSREDANLAGALADCGDFDSASEITKTIPRYSIHDIASARIGLAYGRRGDFDQANAAFKTIQDTREGISAVHEVAILEAKAGQFEAAMQIATRQRVEAETMDLYSYPRYDTINAVCREAALAKVPAETIVAAIRGLETPQERAVGYIGLARGVFESLAPRPDDAAPVASPH